jgi:hypothetical protein
MLKTTAIMLSAALAIGTAAPAFAASAKSGKASGATERQKIVNSDQGGALSAEERRWFERDTGPIQNAR